MLTFDFRSSLGDRVGPGEWINSWSAEFDSRKYPEDCYEELVANAYNLSDADFDILGAWKDGAIRQAPPGTGRQFGHCWVSFTGTWSNTAAMCAYDVWRDLPRHRSVLEQHLRVHEHSEFLEHLRQQVYLKRSRDGELPATFGLSRATYVLHVLSGATFPIYDKNTHLGIHRLTGGRDGGRAIPRTKKDDPAWYLGTFCSIVRELEKNCAVSPRKIDQALFCYGKRRR